MNRQIALLLITLSMFSFLYLKSRSNGNSSVTAALFLSQPTTKVVQITGDLIHPGTYEISDNNLTINVIKMAIPLCSDQLENKDPTLLLPLKEGYRYHFACKPTKNRQLVNITKIPAAQALTLEIPLDLNQMTGADLELLPGIGPQIAKRIVEYRQYYGDFKTKKELLLIEGIGEKKFKNISLFFNLPE